MRYKLLSIAVLIAILFASCVRDPIYNTTHPNHGKIILTADWTEIGSGITPPVGYTVALRDGRNPSNNYEEPLTGNENTIDKFFSPALYRMNVYNSPAKISVSGAVASVDVLNETGPQAEKLIDPQPQWLFTCAMDANIKKDMVHAITAGMTQQVRQLTIVLSPAGGTTNQISAITGYLSGVAGSYDLDSGEHSSSSSVKMEFAKSQDGKWRSTVRLLGITGQTQKLTGTIAFSGAAASVALDSDISAELAAFNTTKKNPFSLDGQIDELHTESDFTATITDWTVKTDAIDVN